MAFTRGYHVPNYNEIVENAFAYARKEAEHIDIRDKSLLIKTKERTRIKFAAEYVNRIFNNIVSKFPLIDKLNPFYRHMINNSLDVPELRKALGHINKTTELIDALTSEYLVSVGKRQYQLAGRTRNEFYGRLKSVAKRTNNSLEVVKKAYITISSIPLVRDLPTSILIGLPNVGKSTFLNKLTGANVEIKDYPFTTKTLQVGMLKHNYLEFQIIDSPGLLDRADEKQNVIEKQTIIALKNIANSIIYVIDLTQSIKSQINVVNKNYIKNLATLFIFTKIDRVSKDDADEFISDFVKKIKFKYNEENMFILNLNDKVDLEKIIDIIYKQNKKGYIRKN